MQSKDCHLPKGPCHLLKGPCVTFTHPLKGSVLGSFALQKSMLYSGQPGRLESQPQGPPS